MTRTLYGLAYNGQLLGLSAEAGEFEEGYEVYYSLTQSGNQPWLTENRSVAEQVSEESPRIPLLPDFPANPYANECFVVEVTLDFDAPEF
jgi:hypothetical protein